MQAIEAPPVNHGVMLTTVPGYFRGYLGLDPLKAIAPVDWLVVSEQHLLMLTSGRVFMTHQAN
jgi:hypothetical protein